MGELGDVRATELTVNVLIPNTRNNLPNDAASCHRRHKFTCFIKLISRALYSRHLKKIVICCYGIEGFQKLACVGNTAKTDMTESPAIKWNKDASYSHCTVNITPFREIMSGNEDVARRTEITRRRGLLIQKEKKNKNFVTILQLN
jgi:hypothetical protein